MVLETAVAWGLAHPYLAILLASIFTTEVLRPTVVYVIFPDTKSLDISRPIGYDVGLNIIKEIENQIPLIINENEHADLVLTRNQVIDVLEGQLKIIEKRLSESEGQLDAYQRELKEIKEEHDKVIQRMKTLEENIKLQNDRKKLQEESKVSVTSTDYLNKEGILEKIDFIRTRLDKLENITGTLTKIVIGIILVIVILFAVIFVMYRLKRCERMLRTYIENTRDVTTEIQSRTVVPDYTSQSAVENVKPITVVSFQGDSALASHKQMVESVINGKEVNDLLVERRITIEMKQVLVNTAADTEKIKSSLFIFVFVDHNDARTILEDQLSKVKTKTVQAAMKKSDKVIVVYCRDMKSKNLDLGILYNPRLENLLSDPLLLELRKQQSIYSIYNSFTYFQQCHLTKKLESSLKSSEETVSVPSTGDFQPNSGMHNDCE